MTDIASRVARNSAFGVGRFLVSAPILFFTTPFLLSHLGTERFGVWALMSIVTAYAQLTDLGMAQGVIKFVAEVDPKRDAGRINRVLNSALLIYIVTGSLAALGVVTASDFLVKSVFQIPDHLVEEALLVIRIVPVVFAISMVSALFSSVLAGLLRLDLVNVALVVYSVLDASGSVLVVQLGWGLVGLAMSRLVLTLIMVAAYFLLMKNAVSGVRLGSVWVSRQCIRELLGYGLNVQVGALSRVVRESVAKLVINYVVSVGAVSLFDITARLVSQSKNIFLAALASILPASSTLHSSGERSRLVLMYRLSVRYVLLAVLPANLLLASMAGAFVSLWLGQGYELVGQGVQVLALASAMDTVAVPAFEILSGTEFIALATRLSVISSIVIAGLCLSFGMIWGYSGVIFGLATALIVMAVTIMWFCHRKIGTSFGGLAQAVSWRGVCWAAVVASLTAVAANRIDFVAPVGWVALFGLLATAGIAYLIAVLAGGILTRSDLMLLKRVAPHPLAQLIRVS